MIPRSVYCGLLAVLGRYISRHRGPCNMYLHPPMTAIGLTASVCLLSATAIDTRVTLTIDAAPGMCRADLQRRVETHVPASSFNGPVHLCVISMRG
jgi:hypothetical protein